MNAGDERRESRFIGRAKWSCGWAWDHAGILCKMGMGGESWVQQFTNGRPVMGHIVEPGTHPVDKSCKQSELPPDQLFDTAKHWIKARTSRWVYPDADQLWEEAADQVDSGGLDGPFPVDDGGRSSTRGCP